MFKKKFKVASQNLVSNKDKKNMIKILKLVYPENEVDKLVTTDSELRMDKIAGSKDKIYTLISPEESREVQTPLFACHEAKGGVQELYPTIYALFKVPYLTKTVFYLKRGVESFITNGANLMWPGVDRVETATPQQDDDEESKGGKEKNKKLSKWQAKQYDNMSSNIVSIFYK